MNEVLERIENLSESQVIEVLNELHSKLFRLIDYKEVIGNATACGEDDVKFLVNLGTQHKSAVKNFDEAGETAKDLLKLMASEEAYKDVVSDVLDEIESNEHMSVVATIVAVGLMVNLTLLVATTKIKYEEGKITIIKGRAPTSLVKTVLTPVKALAENA